MAEPMYRELVDQLQTLRSAIVCDSLEEVGEVPSVMDASIRPLDRSARVVGFAATAHVVEVSGRPEDPTDNYRSELALVDSLGPGDVVVTSQARAAGFWGELLATSAAARGAVGFVGDCLARDSAQLIAMGAPTYVAGLNPLDSIGRLDIDELNVDIQCGGVVVRNGDLIVADSDGVVAVPRSLVEQIIQLVSSKLRQEDVMRRDLVAGVPIGDAYAEHGVL